MPYRAMLFMVVTVALALLAVALWVAAVGPYLPHEGAATQPAAMTDSGRSMMAVFKGTSLLAFLLVVLLVVIGILATFREWMRPRPAGGKGRTRYVDAWKIAGERMEAPQEEPGEENEGEGDEEGPSGKGPRE